jgi:translation initiation factor 2 subunit 1
MNIDIESHMALRKKAVRFYEDALPTVGDFIVAEIDEIKDLSISTSMLEYANINGTLMFSELSRTRIKSLSNIIKVGKIEVLEVLNVDIDKNIVELSRKRVNDEDRTLTMQQYSQSLKVNQFVKECAIYSNMDPLKIYQDWIWQMDRDPYVVLNDCIQTGDYTCVPDWILETVKIILPKYITTETYRVKAHVDLNCYTVKGIRSIQEALAEYKTVDSKTAISVTLVKSPTYLIVTETTDRDAGVTVIGQCVERIITKIENLGGTGLMTSKVSVFTL